MTRERIASQGFEHPAPPKQEMKERICTAARVEEGMETGRQFKPETPARLRETCKKSSRPTEFPRAFVAVVDEVAQVLTLVLKGMQKAAHPPSLRIEKAERPA